jgi:hypothetical protein
MNELAVTITTDLHAFVLTERDSLSVEGKDTNLFAFVFGEVLRYYGFVTLVLNDYRPIAEAYVALSERHMEAIQLHQSAYEAVSRAQLLEAQTRVELQVEAYYLFAAILLDRIASVTQYYFGVGTKPWNSFDGMRRYFSSYAQTKNLASVPGRTQQLMDALHAHVSVFRNEYIVHKHDHDKDYHRRLHPAIAADVSTREVWLTLGVLYPKPGEKTVTAERPRRLQAYLDEFITVWLDVIRANRPHRAL